MQKENNLLSTIKIIDVHKELFSRGNYDFITIREVDGLVKKHQIQEDALKILADNSITDFLYGGAAGGAKSWTGCTWLLFMCLCFPKTRWFIGREELKRITESTLVTFYKVAEAYGCTEFSFNGQKNHIKFYNGSQIDLIELKYQPRDPLYERFGSLEYTGGWIEEGGEIDFGAYDTIRTRIGRHLNEHYNLKKKLFITCNPKKNWMYRVFYKPFIQKALKKSFRFLQALVQDNPFIEKDYIDTLKEISDTAKRERLLLANWDYEDNPNALMDYDSILGMFTNEYIVRGRERYLTCDIAYEGSDMFVIGYWEGYRLVKIYAFDKMDETMVGKKIHDIRIKHKVPVKNVVYDADGLKKFVRHSAKTGYLKGAKEFYNNGRPFKVKGKDENFKNLKAQCYFLLADMVQASEIHIEDKQYRKQIIEEAEQINKLPLADDGKQAMEKKDDLKKRLGRSPDFLDMMMMRMYFELAPKPVKVY